MTVVPSLIKVSVLRKMKSLPKAQLEASGVQKTTVC